MATPKAAASDRVAAPPFDEAAFTAALARRDYGRALTMTMSHYGDSIFRYAYSMLGDQQLAEEIRQLVFMAAFRDLSRFEQRSSVQTWLFGIARHRCLDARRRQRINDRHPREELSSDLEVEVEDSDLDQDLDRNRFAQILTACLNKLQPAAREAVVLRYQQDLPYNEVAALMGERAGTVQQRVARALPLLRKCVDTKLTPGGKR